MTGPTPPAERTDTVDFLTRPAGQAAREAETCALRDERARTGGPSTCPLWTSTERLARRPVDARFAMAKQSRHISRACARGSEMSLAAAGVGVLVERR
jgi:hypothetical protein